MTRATKPYMGTFFPIYVIHKRIFYWTKALVSTPGDPDLWPADPLGAGSVHMHTDIDRQTPTYAHMLTHTHTHECMHIPKSAVISLMDMYYKARRHGKCCYE